MWPHRRSRSSPFQEWWVAFHSYMGQMFDKTRDQMNNWSWDIPCAFGNQVNRSNLQTTRSGMGRGKGWGRQRRKGRGRETVKGKVLLNKPQEELISLMPLLCSCRRKCMRQTRTWRANQRGYIESRKQYPPCQFPQMMIPTLPRSQTANLTQNLILMWICTWRMM